MVDALKTANVHCITLIHEDHNIIGSAKQLINNEAKFYIVTGSNL